ncbi:SPOSA6832_05087 [Sporobolomyces salmonicolor]|uniref:SPOSA6832_05087-mRNA-1:cds n=1 Tax=Sporidiobolus salmonicolor TaxID=5005 RepID=A0A0D6ESW3_SPOSA|nr:SPOSA6832_05087 [Sporobolomyces salmonicolor]
MTSLPQLYRQTLRQFVQNSIHPRTARSPTIPAHLRLFFESARTFQPGSADATQFSRDVENMVVFMRAHRLHKELVERYNPTHDLTQAERAEKSANMVGLKFPEQFEAGTAPTMEQGKNRQPGQPAQGSLHTMFAPGE